MSSQPYLYGAKTSIESHPEGLNIDRTIDRIRPYSMVPLETLVDLAYQVHAIIDLDVPGDFVECGVWNGGASFLIADILRERGIRGRKVWLFDSFKGYPDPGEKDGKKVLQYSKNKNSVWYLDNCRASLDQVKETAAALGIDAYTEFVPGWFNETLPSTRQRIGPLSLLRIDGNWYASDKCCLENLYDQVVDGGLVTVNTYYTYDGSATALHEFFGSRSLSHRIEPVLGPPADPALYLAAVFRKGKSTWKWFQRTHRLDLQIRQYISTGSAFILIDGDVLGGAVGTGRRRIPFVEKEGNYWGLPSDDAHAISEMERLRAAGATHLAVAWPAFWWLENYPEFNQHLRSRFRCVAENDLVVLFDLGT